MNWRKTNRKISVKFCNIYIYLFIKSDHFYATVCIRGASDNKTFKAYLVSVWKIDLDLRGCYYSFATFLKLSFSICLIHFSSSELERVTKT